MSSAPLRSCALLFPFDAFQNGKSRQFKSRIVIIPGKRHGIVMHSFKGSELYMRMLRPRRMAALVVVTALTAYGQDRTAANEKNIREAVEVMLAKQRACIFIRPPATESNRLPMERKNLDVLVALGLLKRVSVTRDSQFGRRLPDIEYQVTPEGQKYMQPHRGGSGFDFCYATPRLERLIRWTAPSGQFGKTMSEATYTYTLTQVAGWARDPRFRAIVPLKLILAELDKTTERKSTLVLTNRGWEGDERWPVAGNL